MTSFCGTRDNIQQEASDVLSGATAEVGPKQLAALANKTGTTGTPCQLPATMVGQQVT